MLSPCGVIKLLPYETRCDHEGPRVFASPGRALASMFLVESDDSWVQSGVMDDAPYIIISTKCDTEIWTLGGAIYALPSETFECDPSKGLGRDEWTSAVAVKPISMEVIPVALDDMLWHGVRIYFVDQDTFHQIRVAPDHGKAIVKSLRPLG